MFVGAVEQVKGADGAYNRGERSTEHSQIYVRGEYQTCTATTQRTTGWILRCTKTRDGNVTQIQGKCKIVFVENTLYCGNIFFNFVASS